MDKREKMKQHNVGFNVGFKIINKSGFHITFKNHLTVSVQFGLGTYTENRTKCNENEKCLNAEIAIIDSNDQFVTSKFFADDPYVTDVAGYLSPEQVAKIILDVSEYPEILEIDEHPPKSKQKEK